MIADLSKYENVKTGILIDTHRDHLRVKVGNYLRAQAFSNLHVLSIEYLQDVICKEYVCYIIVGTPKQKEIL